MTFGPSGLGVTNYLGVTSPTPPNFVTALRNPDQNDYFNFNVGDLWLNMSSIRQVPSVPPTAKDVFMLVSKAAHVATWVNFQGGNTSVTTLTGNSGGPVGVDNNDNINVVGDGTTITIAGNPGTHTLTVSAIGMDQTLTGNSGGAVGVDGAHNINVVGDGTTITIAGNPGTHTLTASASGTGVMSALQPDVGGVVHPVGGVINIHNTDGNVVTSNGGANNLNVNLANNVIIPGFFLSSPGSSVPDPGSATINGSGIQVERDTADDIGPHFDFVKSRNFAIVQDSDDCGLINFTGFNGTIFQATATITSEAIAPIAVNSVPGNLIFSTSPGAIGSFARRMIINPNGSVTVNAADAGATSLAVTGGIKSITSFGQAGNGTGIALLIDNTGLLCTVASSIKYKENVEELGDFSDILYNLKPKKFNFKKEPNVKAWGLIAEEVAEIFPEIVSYDENYEPQSIKYHELTVLLLNELQKLNNRVKMLEESLGD